MATERDQTNERSGQDGGERDEQRGDLIPGSLASLETTLPPTPLKKLLAADGASIFVLSSDTTLIDTVHEAAGEQYPVHTVPDWSSLLNIVEDGRCHIVLLDSDLGGAALKPRLVELRELAPALVVLVAAPRDVAQDLIGLLSERTVHRLLIKPAAIGITRLLLESAVGRYLQLRDSAPLEASEGLRTPVRPAPAQSDTRLSPWYVAVALVSLLLGALIATTIVRNSAPDAVPADAAAGNGTPTVLPTLEVAPDPIVGNPVPESAAGFAAESAGSDDGAETAAAEDSESGNVGPESEDAPGPDTIAAGGVTDDSLAGQLASAASAADQGLLVAPAGASAADLYMAILDLDPGHEAADAGLAAVLDRAFESVEAALLAGEVDRAATELDQISRFDSGSSRFTLLNGQVERSLELAAATPEAVVPAAPDVPRPAVVLPPSELDSFLTLAETRLGQGQIFEPAGDSARDYFDRAAAIDPDDSRLAVLRNELATVTADQARLLLEAGDLDVAAELINDARLLGVETDTLVQLDLDLTSAIEQRAARDQAALLAGALDSLRLGRLLEPPQTSALEQLEQLAAENPTFPGLSEARARLQLALVSRAEDAVAANDWSAAETAIAGLERSGYEQTALAALRGDAEAERLQADYLQNAASTGELTIIESSPAEYPDNAVRREIEGWVELEFVVDTSGVPTDLRVVAAEPEGWFEESALEAIAAYRYAPFERDGRVYARRARLRMSFGFQ